MVLLQQEPTYSICFATMSKYLSKSPSNEFISASNSYFQTLCNSLSDDVVLGKARNFLDSIFNDFAVLKNLSGMVDRMLQVFCTGLRKSNRGNQESIEEVNRYVVTLSAAAEPSNELMLAFKNMLEKSDPDATDFEKLKNLIFDQIKDQKEKDDLLIVKHTKIYGMLVFIFYRRIPLEIMKFIKDLCDISDVNKVAAHRAEIDLFLTERLLDEKKGIDLEEETVEKILEILYSISSVVSSPLIVNRFISLFSPQNDKISKYYDKYMKILCQFMKDNLTVPLETFPIEPMFCVRTNDIVLQTNEGFTFTAWVFIDLYSFTRLFELVDNETNKSIVCSSLNDKEMKWDDMSLFDNLPLRKWFFIALTYKSGLVSCYFNGKSVKEMIVPFLDFNKKKF